MMFRFFITGIKKRNLPGENSFYMNWKTLEFHPYIGDCTTTMIAIDSSMLYCVYSCNQNRGRFSALVFH